MKFSSRFRGFSLIELMVATVLVAVLMAGVMAMLGGIGRDRKTMETIQANRRPVELLELLRFDLASAETMTQAPGGSAVMFSGHGGIDPKTRLPNQRMARVTYSVRRVGNEELLIREQEYLDDRARPERWGQLAGSGVVGFGIGADAMERTSGREMGNAQAAVTSNVPARVRVRIETKENVVDEELWVK